MIGEERSNGEEIVGRFYEKELQEADKKELQVEKVIKRKETTIKQ